MNFDEKIAQLVLAKNEATDTTCFIAFYPSATGAVKPKTNAGLTLNSATVVLTAGGFITTGSARADGYIGVGKAPEVALDIQGATTAASSFALKCTAANLFLQNSLQAGTTILYQYCFGQSYSTYQRYIQASSLFDVTGAGGLGFCAATAGAPIKFWTNGSNLRMMIDTNGVMSIYGDLDHDGSNAGFFGTAPASQQAGYAVPTDLATCISALTTLRTALINYGLTTTV